HGLNDSAQSTRPNFPTVGIWRTFEQKRAVWRNVLAQLRTVWHLLHQFHWMSKAQRILPIESDHDRLKTRPLRSLRVIYQASTILLAMSLVAVPAIAVEKWYVEFTDQSLDESVVRRAVALELREVEIPGDPRRAGDSREKVSLRVLIAQEGDFIEVSLWDRGEYA